MTDRITYPDTLMFSRLGDGEQYATVTQILQCEDLPEATVHIPHWRVNGKPAAIRVRAPSLAHLDQIGRAEAGAAQFITTIQLCCVVPSWTAEQAAALWDKNPHAVEQIARFAWILGTLDHDWIDTTVQQLTGAAPAPTEEPTERAAPANPRSRVRRVA